MGYIKRILGVCPLSDKTRVLSGSTTWKRIFPLVFVNGGLLWGTLHRGKRTNAK